MNLRAHLLLAKALADPNRIRLLLALRPGEACVCQLVELLELAPSTVSRHLSILHQAGLVNSRKEGRWIHYSLPDGDASPAVQGAIDWVSASLAGDVRILDDARRLKKILKLDPTELCKQQCEK